MKNFFTFIIFIALIAGVLWYFGRETADPDRKIEWGTTFSLTFAQKMGLDWKKAYLEILDDLKIKNLRLIAYWTEIEPKDDLWDWRDLDWQIEEARKRDVKIILAVGQRLPRWPECYIPEWAKSGSSDKNFTPNEVEGQKLLEYIEEVVNRYKDNSAIYVWEVENEPFLNFGECPALDEKLLDEEIALVKKLDIRPIMITDSGELSIWYYAAKRADIFGTTMYRYVWHKWLGSYRYPIPPEFFRVKEKIVRLFVGQEKPFVVIELQGEPWNQTQIYETPLEKQLELMSIERFKDLIEYAKKTGFSEYYLWGAEWWYYLKQNGHTEYWEYVKGLNNF